MNDLAAIPVQVYAFVLSDLRADEVSGSSGLLNPRDTASRSRFNPETRTTLPCPARSARSASYFVFSLTPKAKTARCPGECMRLTATRSIARSIPSTPELQIAYPRSDNPFAGRSDELS